MNRALQDELARVNSKSRLSSVLLSMFLKSCPPVALVSHTLGRPIRILFLCILAGGSGDAMLAIKLRDQMYTWFKDSVHITIATNGLKQMISLGESVDNKIFLQPIDKGELEHRPFDRYKAYSAQEAFSKIKTVQNASTVKLKSSASLDGYDAYFVTPLTADLAPTSVSTNLRQRQVSRLIPSANVLNTFFVSEYNLPLSPQIQVPLGLGRGRLGILAASQTAGAPLAQLKYPYTIMYLNDNDAHLNHCMRVFLQMVSEKYAHLSRIDVVVPSHIANELEERDIRNLSRKVFLKSKTGQKEMKGEGVGVFMLRTDIMPLPWPKMRTLLKHSLPVMLLTGDQSFSDALSLRRRGVTIWYQPLEWKVSFKEALAKELPMKFFKTWRTSCGSLEGLEFKPDYAKFLSRWNFENIGKQRIEACIAASCLQDEWVAKFRALVLRNATPSQIRASLQ